jgi:hypothetical protein
MRQVGVEGSELGRSDRFGTCCAWCVLYIVFLSVPCFRSLGLETISGSWSTTTSCALIENEILRRFRRKFDFISKSMKISILE